MTPPHRLIHPAVSTAGAATILSLLLLSSPSLQAQDVATSSESTTPGTATPPETIKWRSDYNAAYFEAKNGKRLLWIQFTGPWCPNCARMERDSFPQPKIVELAKKSFVPLKLRADMSEDLVARLNLTGLPATVVIDPTDQAILLLQQGYMGPDELASGFGESIALRDKRQNSSAKLLAERSKKDKDKDTGKESGTEASKTSGQKVAETSKPPERNVAELSKPPEEKVAETSKPALKKPEPGLAGFCPVSLVSTHKLVRGRAECSVTHDGKLYHLASAEMVAQFREKPELYVPVNGGHCPVSGVDREKAQPGHPRFGVLYGDRLYLCASSEDRARFLHQPDRYALAHVQEQGYCPHCSRQEGVLVQGDPRFGVVRSGREYWFPDASHRDAFLSSLPGDAKTTR